VCELIGRARAGSGLWFLHRQDFPVEPGQRSMPQMIRWALDLTNSLVNTQGTLVGHTKRVLCIASSPDGKNWAPGSEEGIIFWNAAGEPRGEVHNEKGAVSALAFRPDGQVLASKTAGAEIVFWDVASQIPLDAPLVGHAKHVNSLAFSSDGKQLAAGDADEKVLLWDATTRTRIGTKPLCEFDNPT
jgi:WD40 repeat protein